ncbi:hypothetical protein Angca_008195, partial [Angiostrongylus cantonensis]
MEDTENEKPQQELVDGPGKLYEPYTKNEDLVDKLKLLNYEEGFLKMNTAFKPVHRHYFVNSTNVGEQYFMFTSLAAWLIRIAGNEAYEMPQESHDPNATVAGIMAYLRANDVSVEFSANKLKSGAGEAVLFVLDTLADAALIHVNFHWEKMIPPEREEDDIAVDQDEDDNSSSEIAEEDYIDEDEGVYVDDWFSIAICYFQDNPKQAILHSDIDAQAWRKEVERVTPFLKIVIRQDAKDWRMHLEQMTNLQQKITELIGSVTPKLELVTNEVEKSLERIESRERTLNQQLSVWLSRYKEAKDARAEVRERYKAAFVGVSERTAALQRISEDIDQIKMQIEEQGAKTSDGAPIMKVRQALLKIEEDIQRMNVQIGVLEQSLMQAQLRERVSYATEAYGI